MDPSTLLQVGSVYALNMIIDVAVAKGYIGWPTPDGPLGQYLVSKTKVTITWETPNEVDAAPGGFVLTADQLNATTDTPNLELVYTPALGHKLPAGEHTLKVELKDTAKHEADPAEVKLIVKRLKPTIVWNEPDPCDYVDGGFKLSKKQLDAVITPGAGELKFNPSENTLLPAGEHKLTASAKDNDLYEKAEKSVTLKVRKARVTVTWDNPDDVEYAAGGFVLTKDQLNAKSEPKGVKLKYTPALGATLDAGDHVLKVQIDDSVKNNFEFTPIEVKLKVKRRNPEITWGEPAAVVATGSNFNLTEVQLNANRVSGESVLVYAPSKGTSLSVGSHRLGVSHAESKNYHYADKSVGLNVFADVNRKNGFNALRDGGGFKNSTPLNGTVKQNWDNDTDGVKTKAKELMGLFQDMTGPQLKSYMDSLVDGTTVKRTSQSHDHSEVYKLPGGLQVRYKRLGDRFKNPSRNESSAVPMFSIEMLNPSCTTDFSSGQSDIATKISIGGELAPKGPNDTYIPGGNQGFKDGSCAATHLLCRQAKLAQVIRVKDSVDLEAGTKLTPEALGVALQPGNGPITLTPSKEGSLEAGDTLTVTIKAAATDRFEEATKSVTVHVKKIKPKLIWTPPPDMDWQVGGAKLTKNHLNAKADPGKFTNDIKYTDQYADQEATEVQLGTPLAPGEHTITASLPANSQREAAQNISMTIYVRKATPKITWKAPPPAKDSGQGVVLGKKILNATIVPQLELAYSPIEGTRLSEGSHELQVRNEVNPNYQQVTRKVTFKVKPKED